MRPTTAALPAALALALAGCPDRERLAPPPDAGALASASPALIGTGGDVAQIRPPLVTTRAPAVAPAWSGAGPRALAPLDDGGAMYARASGGRIVAGVLDARGTPVGSGFDVGAVQGEARGVALAARGREALIAWSAGRGDAFERLVLQRVGREGSRVGAPILLGAFRVANSSDSGAGSDALGLGLRVVANARGWLVAARGPATACSRGECHSLRVVQIDAAANEIVAGGGVENPAPAAPVVLAAPPDAPWSAVLTLDAATPRASIAALGTGAFARLAGTPLRAPLVAAWLEPSREPAALLRDDAASARWFLVAAGADGGAATTLAAGAPTLRCDGTAMVVDVLETGGARRAHSVRASAPGGDSLALAAADRAWERADGGAAARPEAVVATSAGLLVWTTDRLELRPCGAPSP